MRLDRDEFQELPRTIDEAFIRLSQFDQEDEDYAQIVDQIAKLTKISQAVAEMTLNVFEATNKQDETITSLNLKSRELDLKVKESDKPTA